MEWQTAASEVAREFIPLYDSLTSSDLQACIGAAVSKYNLSPAFSLEAENLALTLIHRAQEQIEAGTADVFGDVISTYTRAQAIDDGVLVDLGTFSFRPNLTILQEAGIKYPVAITRAAYNLTIQEDGAELPPCQDLSGRMWDVVYLLSLACKRTSGPELRFQVRVLNWRRNSNHTHTIHECVELKAICGPGDDAAPVITVMLPSED